MTNFTEIQSAILFFNFQFLAWISGKTSVVNFRFTSVLPVQSQKALSAPW